MGSEWAMAVERRFDTFAGVPANTQRPLEIRESEEQKVDECFLYSKNVSKPR